MNESKIDKVEIEKQCKKEPTWHEVQKKKLWALRRRCEEERIKKLLNNKTTVEEERKNKLKTERMQREEERNRAEELEKIKQERISQSNDWISQGLCGYCGKEMTGLLNNECKNCMYEVGDIGPAGGVIFYDQGYISNGWRFLEAAPANTEFEPKWISAYVKHGFGVTSRRYQLRHFVSGTERKIGTGKTNTHRILNFFKSIGEVGKIAQLCVTLNSNGYIDWFLPSQDELNLIYVNLKKKNIGEFKDGYYWSSTLNYGDKAWGRYFTDGYIIDFINGDYKNRIRAVRQF